MRKWLPGDDLQTGNNTDEMCLLSNLLVLNGLTLRVCHESVVAGRAAIGVSLLNEHINIL